MARRANIPFPIRGIDRRLAENVQPDLTTGDMLNVHIRDHQTGRLRGAQRPGTSRFTAFDSGERIEHMFQMSRPTDRQATAAVFTGGKLVEEFNVETELESQGVWIYSQNNDNMTGSNYDRAKYDHNGLPVEVGDLIPSGGMIRSQVSPQRKYDIYSRENVIGADGWDIRASVVVTGSAAVSLGWGYLPGFFFGSEITFAFELNNVRIMPLGGNFWFFAYSTGNDIFAPLSGPNYELHISKRGRLITIRVNSFISHITLVPDDAGLPLPVASRVLITLAPHGQGEVAVDRYEVSGGFSRHAIHARPPIQVWGGWSAMPLSVSGGEWIGASTHAGGDTLSSLQRVALAPVDNESMVRYAIDGNVLPGEIRLGQLQTMEMTHGAIMVQPANLRIPDERCIVAFRGSVTHLSYGDIAAVIGATGTLGEMSLGGALVIKINGVQDQEFGTWEYWAYAYIDGELYGKWLIDTHPRLHFTFAVHVFSGRVEIHYGRLDNDYISRMRLLGSIRRKLAGDRVAFGFICNSYQFRWWLQDCVVLVRNRASVNVSGREVMFGAIAGSACWMREIDGSYARLGVGNEFTPNVAMTSANIDEFVYVSDGGAIKRIDTMNRTIGPIVPVEGVPPDGVHIVSAWRGRLLAVRGEDPHNIYASKSGDVTDWEYGPDVPNALQAWVLNAGVPGGSIGRAIRCVIPWRDDILLIGTDSSIFELRGDPADGGAVVILTESVGIWGQSSWCADPGGNVWFYGSGDVFRLAPGGSMPERAFGDRVRDFLLERNSAEYLIQMQWDTGRSGLWLFLVSVLGERSVAVFYDATADAVEFHEFPENHGPISSMIYDGDGLTDRYLLMGGEDGVIRRLDTESLSDDGALVASYVDFTAVKPAGPGNQAKLIESMLVMADGVNHATLSVRTGDEYMSAASANPSWENIIESGRRTSTFRGRARGETFIYRLANESPEHGWAFESLQAAFLPAGRVRK